MSLVMQSGRFPRILQIPVGVSIRTAVAGAGNVIDEPSVTTHRMTGGFMLESFDSINAKPNGGYQIPRPTIADAHQVLTRLHGTDFPGIWANLLATAALNGRETDAAALDRLLTATRTADPVTSLYGRSLAIRVAAHRHLTAAHSIIRSAG
jgi:hypothetical protein